MQLLPVCTLHSKNRGTGEQQSLLAAAGCQASTAPTMHDSECRVSTRLGQHTLCKGGGGDGPLLSQLQLYKG